MQLSALQGSVLEHRIFEDDWQVEFISTAKLFTFINSGQINVPIFTIDRDNIGSVLPTLLLDDGIKEDIINAVNQNLTVKISNQEIAYKD